MHAILVAIVVALAVPAPTRWVSDQAGFLTPGTRVALDERLEAYERATGHQVVVWIGTSLEGEDLATWAVKTFADWKVGRKDMDDGIAMFVFAADRKLDIEVGYGLEDKVPDAIASRIIRDVMTPRLRGGDRDGAVTAGVNAILQAIEGKPFDAAVGPVKPQPSSTVSLVVGGILLGALLWFAIRHPRSALLFLWMVMGRGRGGFGGGGGFGGPR